MLAVCLWDGCAFRDILPSGTANEQVEFGWEQTDGRLWILVGTNSAVSSIPLSFSQRCKHVESRKWKTSYRQWSPCAASVCWRQALADVSFDEERVVIGIRSTNRVVAVDSQCKRTGGLKLSPYFASPPKIPHKRNPSEKHAPSLLPMSWYSQTNERRGSKKKDRLPPQMMLPRTIV